MKLLFDQNLSHRLVKVLEDEFPGSAHVRDFDLQESPDDSIWNHAIEHEFVIVSKDEDFHQRSFLYGHPPKVVWLRMGNCTTAGAADLLLRSANAIRAFVEEEDASFLVLS